MRRIWIAFAIMLLLQGLVLVDWGVQKQGFHVDEITSFVNSNGYYARKLYKSSGYTDVWQTSQYFLDSLYAHADQRFSYATVLENVATDSSVHPPLFHLALHTVLSFFPETFSKWLGIVPNMVYFFVAQVFLFLIARWFLGKKKQWLALLPCLIWGFSAGSVSIVIFIRMYEMLTMWSLGLIYFHLRYISAEKPAKWLVLIGVFSFLCFMTHYYSIVFIFFLAGLFTLDRLIRRGWKAALAYAATVLGALGLMVACWPVTITKGVIGSSRGTEAVSNLKESTAQLIREHLSDYLSIVQKALFDGRMTWLFLAMALLLLIVLFKALFRAFSEKVPEAQARAFLPLRVRLERCRFALTDGRIAAFLLSVAGLATFLMIVVVAPYQDLRYISFLLPLLVIVIFLFAKWLAGHLFKCRAVFPIVMAVIFALTTGLSYRDGSVQYLYQNQGEANEKIEETDCDVAICFYSVVNRTALDFVQYMLFDAVYLTDVSSFGSFPVILADQDTTNGVVVFLDKSQDMDAAVAEILANTNLTSYQKLYTDSYFNVLWFSV